MNVSGFITAILLMVGIMVSPADVGGGLWWTLVFYVLAYALARSHEERWGWKRAGFIALVAFILSLFSCVTYQAVPIIQDMPIEGVMGISGAIYPLWGSVSPKAKAFGKEIVLALIKRK